MNKIIALVLAFIFLFSLSGCGNTDTTNPITEQPIDNNYVDTIKEIKDITNNMNGMCFLDGFDIEEPFFEDESYIWSTVDIGEPDNEWVAYCYDVHGNFYNSFPLESTGTYRAVFTVEFYGTSGEVDVIEDTIESAYE